MIYIDVQSNEYICDECGARLVGDVDETQRAEFVLAHGQCRKARTE